MTLKKVAVSFLLSLPQPNPNNLRLLKVVVCKSLFTHYSHGWMKIKMMRRYDGHVPPNNAENRNKLSFLGTGSSDTSFKRRCKKRATMGIGSVVGIGGYQDIIVFKSIMIDRKSVYAISPIFDIKHVASLV